MTRVFLTGATGVMGMAALNELTSFPDKYEISVLARNSKINHKKLKPFIQKGVKVIWGDLLDSNSIRKGVEKADIVLHVGGMVSPMAEFYPDKTLKVNVGSMKLITGAVKELEDKEPARIIKVVYIGSVSQYGSKLPPYHWGKAGDLLQSAKMDAYAVSKIMAERALVEAGLKKWVSIRQTAILHAGLLKNANNPVTFHVPINGALEWISTEDSGRLLERICRPDVPDSFWNHFYNAGGGETFRLTNLEFERGILGALGCPPPEKAFDTKWFASDNFHGMWFEDSDYLDSILHYREPDNFQNALSRLREKLPFYYRLAFLAPSSVIKSFMKRIAQTPELGTLWWLKTNQEDRIKAAWGSRENYEKIPSWKEWPELKLEKQTPSAEIKKGQPDTSLKKTKCKAGHEYFTSSSLEEGGHGCPYCLCEESMINPTKIDSLT